MTRTLTTLALLLATTIPALADGKTDTLAVVGMAIAEAECGLMPNMQDAQRTAERSLAFTGLSREQYLKSISDAIAFKTSEMYADRSIGRFCVEMARIYGGVR